MDGSALFIIIHPQLPVTASQSMSMDRKKTHHLSIIFLIACSGAFLLNCSGSPEEDEATLHGTSTSADFVIEDWLISDFITDEIQGVTVLGNPTITDSPFGKAVYFDGKNDGIQLDYNPLTGLSRFTVEVVMRPDGDGPPQQRYLHFGLSDSDRVLMETRVRDDRRWYHDSFVQSGESSYVQKDPDLLHPTDEWYHVALVFDRGTYSTWLNGVKELEGSVPFTPHESGRTSIGVRMNQVFWYQGYFHRIRISDRPLDPDNFLIQDS